MRVISVLFVLCFAGCLRGGLPEAVANTESASCFAASELALFVSREAEKPIAPPVKPTAEPVKEKRPELIFWTKRGCAPCKQILGEFEACKDELPFVVVAKDDTVKQPDWLPSWPTMHWQTAEDKWSCFSPSRESPWPGVDEFCRMWRKSFPKVAASAEPAAGIGAGKLPIRATIQQLKQLLSAKGLALPFGLTVKSPRGLLASVTQVGENVLIEFDPKTLPEVSFRGEVRSVTLNEQRGTVSIDGLPDITFEVTQ